MGCAAGANQPCLAVMKRTNLPNGVLTEGAMRRIEHLPLVRSTDESDPVSTHELIYQRLRIEPNSGGEVIPYTQASKTPDIHGVGCSPADFKALTYAGENVRIQEFNGCLGRFKKRMF
jgi:hypothetical protein